MNRVLARDFLFYFSCFIKRKVVLCYEEKGKIQRGKKEWSVSERRSRIAFYDEHSLDAPHVGPVDLRKDEGEKEIPRFTSGIRTLLGELFSSAAGTLSDLRFLTGIVVIGREVCVMKGWEVRG